MKAMNSIPTTVSTYLQDHAPKGDLIGYWLDKNREYNVLMLHRRDGEFLFSVSAFPEVVGHWGHQLSGGELGIEAMKRQLDYGLWDVDEAVKERVGMIIDRLENGLGIDEIIAACRKVCDPRGLLEPFKPSLPLRGPQLTSEGQFRTISALVNGLADENPELANESAHKLAAMGITEDAGPLFARDALLRFRKQQDIVR